MKKKKIIEAANDHDNINANDDDDDNVKANDECNANTLWSRGFD